MYGLPQKLAAEFIGVFAFVFLGAGSVCADQMMRTAGGAGIGLLGIALAHGLALGVMIAAIGRISGGHLNPAVTIGFWVTKRLRTTDALLYGAVQLLGSLAAAYLLAAILPETVWRPAALGTPVLAMDFGRAPAMLLEAVLTFVLVWVFFATAAGSAGAFPKFAGLATGLTVTAAMLLGWPFTGAAMNPARVLGPALVSHHWANHGVYWVGPLLGGVVAAWTYDRLYLGEK